MVHKKILLATTNPDKLREIQQAWADLHVEFLSLADIAPIQEPEETEPTLEGNAMLKAHYYAMHSGLTTLADDSGLFIHALNGWPGVQSARIGKNNDERRAIVLEKTGSLKTEAERAVSYKTALALFDPELQTYQLCLGEDTGILLSAIPEGELVFCYDPLFYLPDLQKTYAQMPVEEKNTRSSRGKALKQMEYHLTNTYSAKKIFVPIAIIVHKGKILMNLRNDPHNPEYHERWEFPGGGIGNGEDVHTAILREVKEETGYDVTILQQLEYIQMNSTTRGGREVYVYLVTFICSITGGQLNPPKNEVIRSHWFTPQDIVQENLIGNNKALYETIYPTVENIIQQHPDL